MQVIQADVLVVGAGPAGSAVASRLARFGHDVLLVEAKTFPRHRIDATLPSAAHPILELIGAAQAVAEEGFLRAGKPLVLWPEETLSRSHESADAVDFGLHIDRRRFDSILLDTARRAGVRILQPARAAVPAKCADTGYWRTVVTSEHKTSLVRSRILIDASGRQISGRRNATGPVTIALYAYWNDSNENSGSAVESFADGWVWRAPVRNNLAVVATIIDPSRVISSGREGLAATYRELLGISRVGRMVLDTCRIQSTVLACDATSRSAFTHSTLDMLRVGDASLSIDPLSSQGILRALASAVQAAVVVNTMLARPPMSDTAAAFYEERQNEQRLHHSRLAQSQYTRVVNHFDTPFWRRRIGDDQRDDLVQEREKRNVQFLSSLGDLKAELAHDIAFTDVPAVSGDFIVLKPGLRKPGERPIVYVNGIEVVELLSKTTFGRQANDLLSAWSLHVGATHALSIFSELARLGVLNIVPATQITKTAESR